MPNYMPSILAWKEQNDVRAVLANVPKEMSPRAVQFSSESEDTQGRFIPLGNFSYFLLQIPSVLLVTYHSPF